MQSINYWRNWTPERQRKIEDCPEAELTKPTKPDSVSFVSPIPREVPIISSASTGMAHHDPAAWTEDFTGWIKKRCIHRDGFEDLGGIGAMHVDFAEYLVRSGSVPCNRTAFEALVRSAGWTVVGGFVYGLFLKEDLWAMNR